eukprot:13939018-Ditylum_brightwellii.AAC.1
MERLVVSTISQSTVQDSNLPLASWMSQVALKNAQKEVKKIWEDTFDHRMKTMSEIAAVHALKGDKAKEFF